MALVFRVCQSGAFAIGKESESLLEPVKHYCPGDHSTGVRLRPISSQLLYFALDTSARIGY
jgi:hypothetical protein